MATRAQVLGDERRPALSGKAVAADLGRLLGLAVALSLAVGLLLTAATIVLP